MLHQVTRGHRCALGFRGLHDSPGQLTSVETLTSRVRDRFERRSVVGQLDLLTRDRRLAVEQEGVLPGLCTLSAALGGLLGFTATHRMRL